jgi:hypothetical protein
MPEELISKRLKSEATQHAAYDIYDRCEESVNKGFLNTVSACYDHDAAKE